MKGKRFFLIFFGVQLFFLNCCSLEPQLKVPVKVLPPKFKNTIPQKDINLQPSECWWKKFNDPVLNSLMEEAFSSNLDLKAALYRLEEAEAQVKKANATFWPHVNLEASAGRMGKANKSTSKYNYSLAASYELDIFMKLKALRNEKILEQLASEEDVKAILLSLSAQIADTYFKIIEYKQKLKIQKQIINELDKTLKLVKLRYTSGLVSSLDIYQAHQNLMANKALVPTMEATIEANKNSLCVLIGKNPTECTLDEIKSATLPENDIFFEHGLPSSILTNRPDIKSAYLRLLAQNKRVAQALAGLFPKFDIFAAFGGDNLEPAHLLDYKNAFWNVFFNLTQPIFRGGAIKAEILRQKAILKKLASNYQQKVITAFNEVETTLFMYNSIKDNLFLLEKRLKDLRASVRLSMLRYRFGLSDFLPVLQAQTSFQSVIQDIISKKYELISNRIQLARVVGGRWMDIKMEAVRKKLNKKAQ